MHCMRLGKQQRSAEVGGEKTMGKKDSKSIWVSAGTLQAAIRDIKSLPQHRRIAKETKEG